MDILGKARLAVKHRNSLETYGRWLFKINSLREWYKDKREEERLPSLVFEGYFKSDEPQLRGQVESTKISYYIRIINKNKKRLVV